MFSTPEVSDLALMWESALPDTCVLAHRGGTTDGYDNAGSATYTAYGTVACRIAPARFRAAETINGGQILATDYMVANLAYRTDLLPTDRLTANGLTYEVQGNLDGRSYPYGLAVAITAVG